MVAPRLQSDHFLVPDHEFPPTDPRPHIPAPERSGLDPVEVVRSVFETMSHQSAGATEKHHRAHSRETRCTRNVQIGLF